MKPDNQIKGWGNTAKYRGYNTKYHSSKWLDFDEIKEQLEQLNTEEEVEAAKAKLFEKYPKMTDKQRDAIHRICADREDHIEFGDEMFGQEEVRVIKTR